MNPQHDNDSQDQRSDGLDDELDELFTLPELASLLRVPPQTLRYWRNQHTGPASFKIGRHVRYRRGDVDRWLREQRAAG